MYFISCLPACAVQCVQSAWRELVLCSHVPGAWWPPVWLSQTTLYLVSPLSLTHSCLSLDISVSSVIPVMCPAPWTDSPEPCLVLEEDYTVTPRPHPVSHPPLDAPLCGTCRHLDLSFFDPSCPGCAEILKSRETRWVIFTEKERYSIF